MTIYTSDNAMEALLRIGVATHQKTEKGFIKNVERLKDIVSSVKIY